MNKKNRLVLLNPGPVNVTPAVRRALGGPDVCHREPEFGRLLARTGQKLLSLFGATRTHEAAFFTGSGTCALESMLISFADGRKKTLVLSNGIYGVRLRKILSVHKLPHAVLSAGLGKFPAWHAVERAIDNPSVGSVALVHHETSTGMLNPLDKVIRLAKKYGKFLLVDAISSLGAERVNLSGIDACAGVSGKCLHGVPGVSFVIVSRRAARKLKTFPKRSLYLDLSQALECGRKNDPAFTPAVQIFYALEAALDELGRQGPRSRISAYREKSDFLEKGLERLGVRYLIEKPFRSHVLQALWVPRGIRYRSLHDRLKKSGFVIYSGQSKLKNRIFRIAPMGAVSKADLGRFLKKLGQILKGK